MLDNDYLERGYQARRARIRSREPSRRWLLVTDVVIALLVLAAVVYWFAGA